MLARHIESHANVKCRAQEYHHRTHLRTWKVVSDSSVSGRDTECSAEVVSPVLSGEDGIEDLRAVLQASRIYGANINETCGLHVHIGLDPALSDEEKARVKRRTWGWYAAYETAIDALHPGRDNYTYCRALGNLVPRGGSRYVKVNIETSYGTVEFRHSGGSLYFSEIEPWIRFCDAVVTLAESSIEIPDLARPIKNCIPMGISRLSEMERARTRSIAVLAPYDLGAWDGLLHYISLATLGGDNREALQRAVRALSERRIA